MKNAMDGLSRAANASLKISECKNQLEALPAKIRELQSELDQIEQQYHEKKTILDRIQQELHQLQHDQASESDKLKDKEERLNTLKTQKEFQAVTREISLAKTSTRDREEKNQKLQSQVEGLASELQPIATQRDALTQQIHDEQSQIQGTLDAIAAEIQNLEADLQIQLGALPDDIRGRYEKIAGVRQPPAALVIDATCQECFMNIPPQLFLEMKRKNEVHSCPSCHRLLYLSEAL